MAKRRSGSSWDDDSYDSPRRPDEWGDDEWASGKRSADPRSSSASRRNDSRSNSSGGGRGRNGVSQDLLREAQQLYQAGRIDESIEICEELVATENLPDARYYLGWIYQEEHLWDDAVAHYSTLLDLPDFALSCFFSLGQCFRAKGDLKQAAQYFDEALDRVNLDGLEHDDADELIQLCYETARTHDDLGNTEEGDNVYTSLLGFLRSRNWQDKVAQAEQQQRMRKAGPSGSSFAARSSPGMTPPPIAPIPPSSSGIARSAFAASGIGGGGGTPSSFLKDQIPGTSQPGATLNPSGSAFPAAQPPPVIFPAGGSYGTPLMPPSYVPPMPPMPPMVAPHMSSPNIPMPITSEAGLAGMPDAMRVQIMHAMREIERYISNGLYTAAIEECLRVIEMAPHYLDVHLSLAEIYVHQGKIDQAVTKYAILIDTFLSNRRVDDGINACHRILQLEPNNLNYRMKLIGLLTTYGRNDDLLRERVLAAETFLRMGYPDRAIEQFEQALMIAPSNIALRQNYALALVRAGHVNQGISELQRILQIDPQNTLALARWHIALCSGTGTLQGGPAVSAINVPQDASTRALGIELLSRLARTMRAEQLKGYDEVLREYLAALETNATNGDLQYGAGIVYHVAHRYQEAVPRYQSAATASGLEVLGHVGAGLSLVGLHETAQAAREFEAALGALRRVPVPAAIWSNRPRLDNEDALIPEAEIAQLLSRVQQGGPSAMLSGSNPQAAGFAPAASFPSTAQPAHGPGRASSAQMEDVYRTIGEITARHANDIPGALYEMVQLVRQYRSQRQYDQAVVVLNEITRIAPEDASVWSELAEISIMRGMLEEGMDQMRHVIEIAMRHGQVAQAAQMYQQISEIQWQMGEQEPAMTTLKQVLGLTPDDMNSRMIYVQYCLERGMRKEAVEQQTVLARYYYHSHQTKEAVAMLQQLIALDSTNEEAYDLLGQTYMAVNEGEQAQRVYRHLARSVPSSLIARDRLNQIQESRNRR